MFLSHILDLASVFLEAELLFENPGDEHLCLHFHPDYYNIIRLRFISL